MTNGNGRTRHEGSEIARFIAHRIERLSPRKSQKDIAAEMGYDKPNIVSMMKSGDTRVPLEKIPALARALEADLRHVYRIAMAQYWPEENAALSEIMGNVVSDAESKVLDVVREVVPHDEGLTPAQLALVAKVLRGTRHGTADSVRDIDAFLDSRAEAKAHA